MLDLPVSETLRSTLIEENKELPKAAMEEYLVSWDKNFSKVEKQLREGDVAMLMTYLEQKGLDTADLYFVFKLGDAAMMHYKRHGKMKVRSVRPYRFV